MAYIYQMHPGNRIRELRKKAGLSQADLARMCGISQPAISQIENDSRPLTVEWMRAFARVFACAPADILGDDDNPHRLSAEEERLIAQYRAADLQQRAIIQRVAEPVQGYTPAPGQRVA